MSGIPHDRPTGRPRNKYTGRARPVKIRYDVPTAQAFAVTAREINDAYTRWALSKAIPPTPDYSMGGRPSGPRVDTITDRDGFKRGNLFA